MTGPITPTLMPEQTESGLEEGRLLFAKECNFIWGAADEANLPEATLPEIAFAGRSNVGKSSLVNALTGRKTLARTSNTPGRTQQLNFFDLGGRMILVDLPGYGYAKESKTKVAAWTGLVKNYLKGRVTLRRICLLIDGRHGLKPNDVEIMDMLDKAAVPYQVVLTKMDKVKKAEQDAVVEKTVAGLRKHPAAHPEVASTSSEEGTGIPELRASLATLALPA
ncbi:ribosome biogenesis GTP-binding protein YihA/YsxC [Skermanella mucosa]|uniref:ribosome biogenesis GTP-binding protein YihA/YsxC n=1 Tax=Skermanella mucosa TaxID=1789672 RepID=UPI00192C19B6|nr:ribosome biogenesis GTP-binding protein YihA/YsxC [Skermanella mucosa]UEM20053.1 ribosome biogenesis GTP-binding protein YihA/YsxC [Skermanella mucosa]